MNEQLIRECLRMLRERERTWREEGNLNVEAAYGTAADMLEYAINDNAECLAQFDYYEKED